MRMAQNGRNAISSFLYKLNPFKSAIPKDQTKSDPLIQTNQNNSSIAEAKLEKHVKAEDSSRIAERKLEKVATSEDNSSFAETKLENNVKSEDNLSPQVLKQKRCPWCPWIISFLCTNSYFDDCPKHDIPKKDRGLKYFCIECPQAGPLCIACMEEEHIEHKFVRVNRCAKTAAVKKSEACCIDSSMVYPYMLSGEPAYFLRSDRPFKPIRKCVVCERVLRGKKIKTWWNMESKKRKRWNKMANDRKDAIYCSLICKLKGVLRANGKSRLSGSALVHDDDYGAAVWGKRHRVDKDRKYMTWEPESDQHHISGKKYSGITSDTDDNDEEGMKDVQEENNILDSSDVDRDINNPKIQFANAHVDWDKVRYCQIIADEDIIDFDEAMRSHNQTVSKGNRKAKANVYITMCNSGQNLFDDDETMRSLNQTSSEDNDDGDSTFDDCDNDSSKDNDDDDDSLEDNNGGDSSEDNDDINTISSLSENVSDDETMSYSNQAVPVDHIDEAINTEHESGRDGISDSDINEDDVEEEDEVEDEIDQGSDYEVKDNNLEHDRKLCHYTKISMDKLEFMVSERDPLTSSFKEGDPMSSYQRSFGDTTETDNTQNNHNTNYSIIPSAIETSKEKTIEISLIESAEPQIKNPKESDQNQDEFLDNENSDIDKTFHSVEPKEGDQNKDGYRNNKTSDIDKIYYSVEPKQGDQNKDEYQDNKTNIDNIVHTLEPKQSGYNQDNENNGIDKIIQIVAEEDIVKRVKGFKDNDKEDHIVAQANETNKPIEDNGKGEDEELHTYDMEVLTNSITVSSSDLKAITAINQAKTFSDHVHKRKLPTREEDHEEHKKYEYEAHYLNHDLYHVTQFENYDGRKENKNTNDLLRSDMEVQTDNVDNYPVVNVHESMTMEAQTDNIDNYPAANVHELLNTMEVQTDIIDTYPVANAHEFSAMEVQTDNIDTFPEVKVHESRTTLKRRKLSNSSPKPLATVTIDIYSPGRTYYS